MFALVAKEDCDCVKTLEKPITRTFNRKCTTVAISAVLGVVVAAAIVVVFGMVLDRTTSEEEEYPLAMLVRDLVQAGMPEDITLMTTKEVTTILETMISAEEETMITAGTIIKAAAVVVVSCFTFSVSNNIDFSFRFQQLFQQ